MATILVVDDKELNRSVLNVLLSHYGHHIVEACDGAEALGKAKVEKPELIITDILMPKMDGYEFVRRLRETQAVPDAKVIFYSALYREEETRSLAAACGVSTLICKPTDPEEILHIVEAVLSSGPPSPPPPPKPEETTEVVRLLSDKLYQKVQELENLNTTLETTVALRTRELEESNYNLRKQIVSRQKAEEAAAADREDKLRLKSDFLSHVSHELRSPLTVVHQFVSILLDGLGGPINANQKEYLETAQRNVNQLKGMIDDLLEASRAESCKLRVKRSVVSLADVLNKALVSFRATAAAKNISLQVNIQDHLPPVYVDPARISQVLTNLLDNAVKFSPEKSVITVRAQVLEEDPAFLRVSVADCGCGIEPEESERIFDRLYQVQNSLQSSRRGLGLGLFICKELISLHGGRIWNDTNRRAGSTFLFTVPIFSLSTMIAPIVKRTTSTEHSFALVIVEVRPLKAWPAEHRREYILNVILNIISRCILPDLDVLLPPQNRGGVDLFWIVARTNKQGADVITKRLREQLSESKELRPAEIVYEVKNVVLNSGEFSNDWPFERKVENIVLCLEKVLQSGTTERKDLVP